LLRALFKSKALAKKAVTRIKMKTQQLAVSCRRL
jgi:hypothetical protein